MASMAVTNEDSPIASSSRLPVIESVHFETDPLLVCVPVHQSRSVRRDHVENLKRLMVTTKGFDTAEGLIRVAKHVNELGEETLVVVDGMHRLTALKELIVEKSLPGCQTVRMSVLTGEHGRNLSSLEILALASRYNQSGHNIATLNFADKLYMTMSILRTLEASADGEVSSEALCATVMDLDALPTTGSTPLSRETVMRFSRVVFSMRNKQLSWEKLLTVAGEKERVVSIELLVTRVFIAASQLEQCLLIDAFEVVRESMNATNRPRRGSFALRNGRETALVAFIEDLFKIWNAHERMTEADTVGGTRRNFFLEAVAQWPGEKWVRAGRGMEDRNYSVAKRVSLLAFESKLKGLVGASQSDARAGTGAATSNPTARLCDVEMEILQLDGPSYAEVGVAAGAAANEPVIASGDVEMANPLLPQSTASEGLVSVPESERLRSGDDDVASGEMSSGASESPEKGPTEHTGAVGESGAGTGTSEEADDEARINPGDAARPMPPAPVPVVSSSFEEPRPKEGTAAATPSGRRLPEEDAVRFETSSGSEARTEGNIASTLTPLRRSLRSVLTPSHGTTAQPVTERQQTTRSAKRRRLSRRATPVRGSASAGNRDRGADADSSGGDGDEEDPAFDDEVLNPPPSTSEDPAVAEVLPAAVEQTRAKYYLSVADCAPVFGELAAVEFQAHAIALQLNGYCTLERAVASDGAIGKAVHDLLASFSQRYGDTDDPWSHIINSNDELVDRDVFRRRVGRMSVSKKALTDEIEPRGSEGDATLYKKKLLVEVALGYVMERVKGSSSETLKFPATGLRLLMTVAHKEGDCPRQAPHIDYELDKDSSRDWTPRASPSYFMMMTGAEGMLLHIWPFSHVLGNGPAGHVERLSAEVPNKLLWIPPFSIFVGRGDLVHAGASDTDRAPGPSPAAYKFNTRVHLYAVRDGYRLLDAIALPSEFKFQYHS